MGQIPLVPLMEFKALFQFRDDPPGHQRIMKLRIMFRGTLLNDTSDRPKQAKFVVLSSLIVPMSSLDVRPIRSHDRGVPARQRPCIDFRARGISPADAAFNAELGLPS